MAEEKRDRSAPDPAELWMKWYETGTKAWSEMLSGDRESYADPWGLYRQWFESMEKVRENLAWGPSDGAEMAETAARAVEATTDPQQMQRWFEAAMRSWQEAAESWMSTMSLAPRWAEVMEKARENMVRQAEGGLPTDPLRFAVQWYNAVSGPLSEFVQEAIEKEEVLGPSSQFLQNYARFYRIFRKASEEYLRTLQIPTRSDVARVAGLVVALEDKVDRIEEAFEEFEYGYAEPATAGEVRSLEERMDRIEEKLDRLLASVGGTRTEEPRNGSGRKEIKATAAARRKAEELGIDLSEVEGTGADGQITVEDVRQKGGR